MHSVPGPKSWEPRAPRIKGAHTAALLKVSFDTSYAPADCTWHMQTSSTSAESSKRPLKAPSQGLLACQQQLRFALQYGIAKFQAALYAHPGSVHQSNADVGRSQNALPCGLTFEGLFELTGCSGCRFGVRLATGFSKFRAGRTKACNLRHKAVSVSSSFPKVV